MSPRSLPLAGFLAAEAVSYVGTRLSMIAVPWLVLTTTGSATRTGLVAFAELAPLVVSKALSGPVIDRVGPRRVAVTCDLLSVLAVGLVPLLHAAGALTFGALLGLVGVAGALRGPGDSAKGALVPALAVHSDAPLERVTGLAGAIERSSGFVGAAAAGGLVAWLGVVDALLVDAASFGVCGLLLWVATGTVDARAERPAGQPGQRASFAREWRDGWDVWRRDTVLVALTVMVAATNLLDQSFTAVLLPVWVREHDHGIGVVGAYLATWSAASAVGAVVAAWLAERLPRFRVYVVAFLVTGLPRFLVFAFLPSLPVVLGLAVVGGLCSGFLNPILSAVIFERIPAGVLGRVSSLVTSLCWVLLPVGGLLGGVLVAGPGLVPALLVVGTAYLVATMLPLVVPTFRAFDRPRDGDENSGNSRRAACRPRSRTARHLPSSSTRG